MPVTGDSSEPVVSSEGSNAFLPLVQDKETLKTPKLSPLDKDFEILVQNTLEKWHIEGVAIADNKGYGIAVLPDTPVRPSTLFYTGSTTKSFTAAAASLLVDDDEKYPNIKWTTPLSRLIREDFVLQDEYATSHVTLEDALSNRTGLPGHMLTLGRVGTVRDVVRSLRHLPMDKEIRTTWQYCNAMFITVAHMIETVTGQWLGDFLREHIWGPLDMNSTFFSLEDARRYVASSDATLAKAYAWDEASLQSKEVPYCEGTLSGAGAVISTVLDYAQYIRSMIRQSGPLSKAGYAALLQPRSFMPQMLPQLKHQMVYTLGLMSSAYRGEPVILHPGGLDGMTSTMIYFPERDWGIAVFCNAAGPGRESLAWHLIDNLFKVPKEERLDLFELAQNKLAKAKTLRSSARERLYPSAPSPGRPNSLPLQEYAGHYTHPAYPDFIITLTSDDPPTLHVTLSGTLNETMSLQHVSGEFFLAELFVTLWGVEPAAVIRAEFQINAEGKAARFGATVDYADMPDTLIWFDRCD
ncbi:penicillin-binding protein [Aspergillus rambellii]|uniref:Penicillin-binding protein n=1 Tax=Aspergillus rambellii TaxID=308745 RepID=A0A0F8UQA0_9EURO|nr:penicillin-binding protein [Aspergillus rambellii]